MKKILLIQFLILVQLMYSQKPYPDTLTAAASAAITPPPPPPPFSPCPSTFRCHENFICGGDFENIPDPRYYAPFVQQHSLSPQSYFDNSIDIYTRTGTNIVVEDWPLGLPFKRTMNNGWISAAIRPCVRTPNNVSAPSGNSFLGMNGIMVDKYPPGMGDWYYSEGISFKLRKDLMAGKSYTLKFYARKPRQLCLNFNLEIRGSTMPPCSLNGANGFTPLWKPNTGWNTPCGYEYSQLWPSPMITDTIWQEHTINITPNANIEYLILSMPQINTTCPSVCAPYGYFDDFRLYDNDPLKMSTVSSVSCGNTGSIKLSPSGGSPPYGYMWLDGATTKDRINVAAGTYHVRVYDAARCDLDLQIFNIPSIQPIVANEAIFHPSCKGYSDGSILLFPSGGTPPYTYAWTGGLPPQQHQYGLASGKYKVTITDKNDCTFAAEYEIIDTLKHIDIITNTIISPYICGGAKGSIQVRPIGGSPPYNYLWADGTRNRDLTGLLPGSYTITVMDKNHCTKTQTYTVTKSGVYGNGKITLTPSYHCHLNTANITSNVTVGVPPYTYLWSTGSTQSFTNNVSTVGNPKVYITFTEGTGCINRDSIHLKTFIDIGTGTAYPSSISATGAGKPLGVSQTADYANFRVHGTFTVNNNANFNLCNFTARPGSKILVDNKRLYIAESHLRTCVDTQWKGIEVINNGSITLVKSTIEDAQYGIEFINHNSNQEVIRNNLFRNNYIGIYYAMRTNPTVSRSLMAEISNNVFTSSVWRSQIKKLFTGEITNTTGNLQFPTDFYLRRAWAGMAICDHGHMFFNNNKFSNMVNGVLMYNVDAPRFTKNIFENMFYENLNVLPTGYPNGTGIYMMNDNYEKEGWLDVTGHGKSNTVNGFTNCRVGIFTIGRITLHALRETKMVNVYEGVSSLLGGRNHVINSDIQATHKGIYFLGTPYGLGTAPGICYDNNQITINGNSDLSNGIEVLQSGGYMPSNGPSQPSYNYSTRIKAQTIHMNGRSSYGVWLNNTKRINSRWFPNPPFVQANTVNVNAPGISRGGINLTKSENIDVMNNLITSTNRTFQHSSAIPAGLFPVGIYMNMSQDTLRCNSMMNLRTGMRFTGTCANTNMQRNKFYNHTNGLKLDNRSTLKPQLNTGNTWLGSYSGGLAAENSQTPAITRFQVGTMAAAKYIASPRVPTFLFSSGGSGDNDACTGAIGNGYSPYAWFWGELRDFILSDNLNFDSYETPLIYQNEAELYEQLKPLEESLADTSDELAFLHQLDTGSIGAFYHIEQKEISSGKLSPADSSLLATAGYLRDSLEYQLSYFDAIRASYADTLEDLMPDTLRSAIDSSMALLLEQISPIRAQLDEYYTLAYTRLQRQCDTILQMVSEVEAIDTPSRLKKSFLSLYYRTIGRGQHHLDTPQIDSFRQLAQLCPLLEPDAVYRSRAIMRLYEDTIFYDDALICNASGMEYKSTKQPKAKPQITCTLAPNPAKDYTTLRFSALPKDPVTISIADIQGRNVYSKTNTLENTEYRLDTKDWNQGIYLIQVIQSNLVIFESKLQIKANE